ncbi:outer membrane beta-barrel protein [Niabella terrae]
MKKIFLGLAALSSVALANAQSGSILVGGNVDFSSYTKDYGEDDTEKSNTLEFAPTIGYQFNDNWTAGVVGSIATNKNRVPISLIDELEGLPGTTYAEDVKTTTLGVGPFVRYTQPLSEVFSLFGQLQGQYLSSTMKEDGENIDSQEQTGFNVGFFPAVFINVKNGFGLNFNIGGIEYTSKKFNETDIKNSNFNVNFGKSVSIGISKNF